MSEYSLADVVAAINRLTDTIQQLHADRGKQIEGVSDGLTNELQTISNTLSEILESQDSEVK